MAAVGAGPYGLSAIAHLRARGLEVHAFGKLMEAWSDRMPAGMLLKSTPDASDLSAPDPGAMLADLSRAEGLAWHDERRQIPVETFIRYGRWFREQVAGEVDPTVVQRVSRAGDGFEITSSDGRRTRARAVVVAAGLSAFAHVPAELRAAAPRVTAPTASFRTPVTIASSPASPVGEQW
ncbi:FAD/NAD(P)-binding protein [Streptomyces sp. S.PB5]|uniref:FAD/NAD(P)-binding protein n=1 Tax=Streptomyces sp. S.PB5 TaxID=3020844 RepID=UPI0025B1DE4D|nr:FAD/NAD(P)-binding protein [Streptomyces sp. S.PB5]MDN3027190.1 FAD/NAD(P)-binding protein [Streptomyces sp. S.PB5]